MEFCQLVTYLWLNLMSLNQYKGNNSCTTDASLIKFDVHQRIMVIYTCIHNMFHRIPLTGNLVMATDGYDGWMDRHEENYIPPPSARDNKFTLGITYKATKLLFPTPLQVSTL